MSRISDEELRRWIAGAYPAPWDFSESLSDDGHEWYGCGVSSGTGHEFVWLEEGPETDNPTARLIALAPALAAEVLQLREEKADLKTSVIAFGAPWAVEHARNMGLPDGHLLAGHYDILKAAGARMDSFTRATPSPVVAKEGRDA